MMNKLEARIEGLEQISDTFGLMHLERLGNASDDALRRSADKIKMRFPTEFSTNLAAEFINFKTLYFNDNDNCPWAVLGYI